MFLKELRLSFGHFLWIAVIIGQVTATTLSHSKLGTVDWILHERAGSTSVADDLYGLGVRVGLYLQGFAFTITAITRDTHVSITLSSCALQFALLANWSILALGRRISPAECLILLQILGFATAPALISSAGSAATPLIIAFRTGTRVKGHGLALVIFMVNSVWCMVLTFWFWSGNYRSLPLLDTSNTAFFFTKVQIDGWFRIYSLVIASLGTFGLCGCLWFGGWAVWEATRYWWGYQYDEDEDYYDSLKFARERIGRTVSIIAICVLIYGLPMQVAATERMISWNGLQPNNNLATPGQLIPFVSGVAAIVDAVLTVFSFRPAHLEW